MITTIALCIAAFLGLAAYAAIGVIILNVLFVIGAVAPSIRPDDDTIFIVAALWPVALVVWALRLARTVFDAIRSAATPVIDTVRPRFNRVRGAVVRIFG